jgi:hypothetical protein
MKVLKIEGIYATVQCDCGSEVVCRKFVWEDKCVFCFAVIKVSELASEYVVGNLPKTKMGRPIGAKDKSPRIVEIDKIKEPDLEVSKEVKNKAKMVIEKFKAKYDLKKIAEFIKKRSK